MKRFYFPEAFHNPNEAFPYGFDLSRAYSSNGPLISPTNADMFAWEAQTREITLWCKDQFGNPSVYIGDGGLWMGNSLGFYWFKRAIEATAFKVCWL